MASMYTIIAYLIEINMNFRHNNIIYCIDELSIRSKELRWKNNRRLIKTRENFLLNM